jgi:hypothetical protein
MQKAHAALVFIASLAAMFLFGFFFHSSAVVALQEMGKTSVFQASFFDLFPLVSSSFRHFLGSPGVVFAGAFFLLLPLFGRELRFFHRFSGVAFRLFLLAAFIFGAMFFFSRFSPFANEAFLLSGVIGFSALFFFGEFLAEKFTPRFSE